MAKQRRKASPAVAKIRERLKCELCGGKTVVVTYLTPSHSTGSLVHLFEKEPRR
jgi:hypothetical protein